MRPDAPASSPLLRFAPSPNGALHLGHAYSALRNQRFATETNGRLLLRIEDLDLTRCKPHYEAAILRDLAWLGIVFDGPARRQSEHLNDFAAALARLDARGLVYPCFCSRAEVARAATARDPDGAPIYAGACRELPAAERQDRIRRGDDAAWRLDMPRAIASAPARLVWREFGEGASAGDCAADPAGWGDVILRGRGLAASYHLAVTVDDALQGVTDVVRGRDLLAATSVHRLLQELLGLPTPRYRHHRLVIDAAGDKLSKSHQSPALATLRQSGAAPEEIRAALGFTSGDGGRLSVALS
jgi:glutamyl-Q tRNA(Asp) synthetase